MIGSHISGHKVYYDSDQNIWKYFDTDEYAGSNPRPCVRCGNHLTGLGYDHCLGNLPGVSSACCGHGVDEGFICFENGAIVRGYFTVERA